jgi:aspartyl-tRNA(Asn)/glutamyl-tRNA(Gln) amidotransferase subunit C
MITRAEVEHIAKLARLALREEEVERMTLELGAMLAYVQQLGELDTSGVEPTAQVMADRPPLRADEPRPGLQREPVLGQSPNSSHDGFAVPAFVDD